MHNEFDPKSNVDSLYLRRSEAGRVLIGDQDTVNSNFWDKK